MYKIQSQMLQTAITISEETYWYEIPHTFRKMADNFYFQNHYLIVWTLCKQGS